uniref:Aminotransferase-like plant mobile domain-containing protein n=1 Tax=Fagus sylvatica TaxID=28930 RepID=A0A2N9H9E9_FAGSY
MASSSSNPSPDPTMASGGDSQNLTADTENVVAGAIDGESVDPSRFSLVPEDDRESFVFPLLDPWFDNGDNFPYVPSKVSLSPPDWEWMLRGQRSYRRQVPIDFEFPYFASVDWAHWVRDTETLLQILRRWCASTHTFFFSWGEFTITLEDVENHWMLPMLEELSAVEMSEEETRVEQALKDRSNIRINAWSLYFAKGTDHPIRCAAFIAYWLYNLPLVYRWVGLRVKDPDLVPSLDFEECIVWRPYSYRYAGFSCHSILYWFSDIASQSFELLPDDSKSLMYLSAINPGWLPVWSSKGIEYTHYCVNRVRRQFGLDQGVPGSPSETLPQVPSVAPFLMGQAFGYWSQSVSRMVIPCGGRLDICTVVMQEYWLRVTAAMADYIGQGRGTRVPLPNCHNPIFTHGVFSGVGAQNEATRTKSACSDEGSSPSNTPKKKVRDTFPKRISRASIPYFTGRKRTRNERELWPKLRKNGPTLSQILVSVVDKTAHLGGNVCAKILSDPLQLGPRAKTLRQEVHFSYHMQLSDRQEFLRSSRNLSQKMTPWHKEHSDGLCSQDHILRTQNRLCARPVPLKSRVFLTRNKLICEPGHIGKKTHSCTTRNSRIAKNLSGPAGIPIGKLPSNGPKTPRWPLFAGPYLTSPSSDFCKSGTLKSRQRKLSDGTKNVKIRHRELGQICARTGTRFEKKRAGSKTHFFSRTAAFARRVFPARNKLIREPGCVGKIMTPATTWNSRFADSIPRLTGIYIGKVHKNSSDTPTSGSHNSLVRTPIRANFISLERGRRELSDDMPHDPF